MLSLTPHSAAGRQFPDERAVMRFPVAFPSHGPPGPPLTRFPPSANAQPRTGSSWGEMEGPETPRGQGRGVGAPRAAGAVTGLSLEACCGLRDGVCCNILPTVQANMGLAPLFLLPFHPNVSGARDCSEHKRHLLSPSLLVNIARLVSLTT